MCVNAVYGYGTVAILIITVISLCGLLIIRFRQRPVYYHIINAMLGLGVGTLVGDAFLHLIPHVRVVIIDVVNALFYSCHAFTFLICFKNVFYMCKTA